MRIGITVFFNVAICILGMFMPSIEKLSIVIKAQMVGNTLLFLSNKSKNYLSIGLVFYLLLCVFHYGRLMVDNEDPLRTVSNAVSLLSYKFSLITISSIATGYLVYVSSVKKDVTKTEIAIDDSLLRKIRTISFWIIGLTIIPLVYIDYIKIQYSFTYGYAGVFLLGNENAFVKYASSFTSFTRPAVLLLVLSYYKVPSKARTILIIFIIFSILEMLSGARATSMIYILAGLLLYLRLFSFKRSRYLILILFISTVYILPSITAVRQTSYSVEDVINATEEKGQLEALLAEFGGTQISVAYALQFTNHFNAGLTYLLSFINISPKIPQLLLPIVSDDLTFTNSFPLDYRATLGGSCLGEAYYNFGWIAPLFTLIIGLLIGKLEVELCVISKQNLYKAIMLLAGIPFILLWVRGFFCTLIFPMFWVPVIYRYFITRIK